jgi:hypothetical protein
MPKTAAVALCLALLLPVALVGDEGDPEPSARVTPREIVAEGLPAGISDYNAPISISGEKRLAEVVPKAEARAAILKQVNFRKERLLLFSWCGASGDTLTPVKGGPGVAAFEYVYFGRTSDCTQYAKLFAIPARATFEVTKKGD